MATVLEPPPSEEAPMSVTVVKVTVQFVDQGTLHEIELDPGRVSSIVFDREDLLRAQLAQHIARGAAPEDIAFVAAGPFPPTADATVRRVGASPEGIGTSPVVVAGARGLWWHTGCRWMHPQGG
jgi:hypothetical protein